MEITKDTRVSEILDQYGPAGAFGQNVTVSPGALSKKPISYRAFLHESAYYPRWSDMVESDHTSTND
jgi:hypothetical protein